MIRSVACPAPEGHGGNTKVMFFIADDGLILHCPKHKFIKLKFSRQGKPISFEDVEVKAEDMPESNQKDFHLENTPLPILAYGQFKAKNGQHNNKD